METAMVVGGCWPAIETASNGYSHGIHFCWPAMDAAMVVSGCWPAMETAMVVGGCWPTMDTAMENIFDGQQWRQPWWLVVAGQQWIQPWKTFLMANNGNS